MRTKYNPKTARFFYLNQDGSRGVSIDANGNRERLPVSLDGIAVKERAVLYHEMCGNFSYPVIRIKGKPVTVYPDSDVEVTMWMPYEVKYKQT